MSIDAPDRPEATGDGGRIRVLNAVVATPEARGGAIRAGLRLGDALADLGDEEPSSDPSGSDPTPIAVDNAKMRGEADGELVAELALDHEVHPLPSRTALRDAANRVVDFDGNYANALVWTRAETPRPLAEYDLVHLHNPHPIAGLASLAVAARRAGVPYVVTTHGVGKLPDLPAAMGMSRPTRTAFERGVLGPYWRVLRGAEHLFALSATDRDRIHRRLPGQSVTVVPNGADPIPPDEAAGERVEERLGIDPSDHLLFFAGDLVESKGIDDLLAAHRLLEGGVRLVVAGRDRSGYADRLRSEEGVAYAGYVDRATLLDLYRRADVFVFPTRTDVFPLSVLEAMAAGTPVVASAVGGIPDQLGAPGADGTAGGTGGEEVSAGVLVPPRAPERVAAAVGELLEDPERRDGLGRRARRRVEREYAWPAVAERVADEYRRILWCPDLSASSVDRST